ncbi:hypothetical protein SLEP1_g35143 [Rubroshorea leprosula]|uniref:Bifunctional inhibitor/plant lipid transfer protein/seed storage helical domain-containing protein n=1 Tax=Rubroshorea leprosula TaxID=152421 RepID=A0AAV5KMB2_9ROSI|nr:hypothetical protein SLEP1_g35143 [Rubroshorea leprosula]
MSSLKKTMAMPLLLLLGLLLSASIASTLNILTCPVNNLVLCVGPLGKVVPSASCCSGVGQFLQIEAILGEQAAKNCLTQVSAIVPLFNITLAIDACGKAPSPKAPCPKAPPPRQ